MRVVRSQAGSLFVDALEVPVADFLPDGFVFLLDAKVAPPDADLAPD
jgi:hypothetical protein